MSAKKRLYYTRFILNETGEYISSKVNYSFTGESVRRYYNNIYLISKLNTTSILLLHYLTEIMDEETNAVANTPFEREKFIDFLWQHCSKNVQDKTVRNSFNLLFKEGLLIQRYDTHSLTVNPLYFFKGSERLRIEFIRKMLKEACFNPQEYNHDIIKKLKIEKY